MNAPTPPPSGFSPLSIEASSGLSAGVVASDSPQPGSAPVPQALCEAAFMAARSGDTDCLRVLLHATPSLAVQRDTSQRTPLMWAAMLGRLECVRLLAPLSQLQDEDSHNSNALHLAADYGQADCLEHLLRLLAPSPSEASRLLLSAIVADSPRAVTLLLHFCDVNAFCPARSPRRQCSARSFSTHVTALATSITSRARSAFRVILPLCDPQLGSSDGMTPLMLAAEHDPSGQLVRALLAVLPPDCTHKVDPETGDTPLLRALRSSNFAAIRLLLPLSDVLVRNRDHRDAHDLVWHLFEESRQLDDEYLECWNLLAAHLPIEQVQMTIQHLQRTLPDRLSFLSQAIAIVDRHALSQELSTSLPLASAAVPDAPRSASDSTEDHAHRHARPLRRL